MDEAAGAEKDPAAGGFDAGGPAPASALREAAGRVVAADFEGRAAAQEALVDLDQDDRAGAADRRASQDEGAGGGPGSLLRRAGGAGRSGAGRCAEPAQARRAGPQDFQQVRGRETETVGWKSPSGRFNREEISQPRA